MKRENTHQRLAKLEAEVAALRSKVEKLTDIRPWWERIVGTFHNDPVYLEAMQLGQAYRQSQRPQDI